MLSSVGLEVMDSISPQLNWKIMTKGRRSRTSAARRKLSVAVSGQPTSGQTEHVPIKKRRHLLRSPSPQPQTPSTCRQYSSSQRYSSSPPFEDNYAYSSHFSAQRSAGAHQKLRDGSAVIKSGEVFDYEVLSKQVCGEHNFVGDFSGIELLAAAASMDDDADNTCKQDLVVGDSLIPKSDISNLATQFKQDSECNKSSSNEIVLEDDTDCSLVSNNLESAAQSLLGCVRGGTMTRTYSLKVDRRHWDLNTSMDAWDEPYNDTITGKTSKDVACNDMHVEGRQGGAEHRILSNPSITEDKFSDLEVKEVKLLAVSPCGTCIELSNPEEALTEPTNICYFNVTTKTSDLDTEKNADYPSASVEKIDSPAASVQKIVSLATSASKTNSHIAFVGNVDLKSSFAVKIDSYPPIADKIDLHMASAEKVDLRVASVEKVDLCGDSAEKIDLYTASAEKIDLYTASAEKIDSYTASAEMIDAYTAAAEKIDQYMVSTGKIDSHITSAGKIDSTVDTQIYSDIHLDNHVHVDDLAKFQEGSDSPYEDGELRGSFMYPWEENELEKKNVDYESDGRHGDSSDAGDLPGSEIVDGGSEGSLGSVRKSLLTKKFLGRNESNDRSVKHSYMHFMEDESENNDHGGKNESDVDLVIGENDNERRFSDQTDAINETGAHMDEYLLRTIQDKVQSCSKGRSSLDAFNGKDIFFLQQCRSRRLGGSDSNPESDMVPDQYLSRYRHAIHGSEKGGADQWMYWGSKGRPTSSYRGVEGRNLNRPRRTTGDFVDKFGRVDFDQKRQNPNYLSRGYLHRRVARSSPVDRGDGFGVRRRMPLTRGITDNYSQGVGKKYDPLPDKTSNSVRLSPYSSIREQSFSPSYGSGIQIPLTRRRSRSRSRTRSPTTWHSNKGREMGTRRHIRSPDFRTEARMGRMKFPNSKTTFTSDHRDGYLSPSRGRFSPQHNGRWFDDLDFADNSLRRQRSPMRSFRRSHKFDATSSSGRLQSHDYFKPTIRSGRFSFVANDGRAGKFETDYGHRRRDDRGDVMHRRRDADDRNLRRYQQSAEADVIETTNSSNMDDVRGTDARNVPKR